MKKSQEIYILCGHLIPNKIEAFTVFTEFPTRADLLKSDRFNDSELDSKLINYLLEHKVAGTSIKGKLYYEYLLISPDQLGNLNFGDYMYTGIIDVSNPDLIIDMED